MIPPVNIWKEFSSVDHLCDSQLNEFRQNRDNEESIYPKKGRFSYFNPDIHLYILQYLILYLGIFLRFRLHSQSRSSSSFNLTLFAIEHH